MKEQKQIDRLFQEKLKNFEATPSDAVWDNIHAELHSKKDDRKIIPIWWKLAGVAAGLLLMLTIGNVVFNDGSTNSVNNEVVDSPTKDSDDTKISTQDSQKQEDNVVLNNELTPQVNGNQLTETDNKDEVLNEANDAITKNPSNSMYKEVSTLNEAVANATTDRKDKVNNSSRILNTINKNYEDVYSTDTVIAEQNPMYENNVSENKASNAVAHNIPQNLPEQPSYKQNTSEDKNSLPVNTSASEAIAATDISKARVPQEALAEGQIEKEEDINNNITDNLKPSIEDALALSEDGEDYNEKEKEVINRWSVTPNVSPVYYNSLGKGSSINSQFNNNSKSGQLNVAYGVNASYAITKKLSVRSGISNVNVGYNTNDVVVYNALGAQPSFVAGVPDNSTAMRNLDLNANVQSVSMISGKNLAVSQMPEIIVQNSNSSIDQEMSFIEIPVELEYKISDKKVGVSLIGGFSTMLLNDNKIYADMGNDRMLLGEANNINNVSYSANFGVGVGVKVSEKMSLNFEPTFKYQINTFNNTSGDFNPYIIGVNSGLKFKF